VCSVSGCRNPNRFFPWAIESNKLSFEWDNQKVLSNEQNGAVFRRYWQWCTSSKPGNTSRHGLKQLELPEASRMKSFLRSKESIPSSLRGGVAKPATPSSQVYSFFLQIMKHAAQKHPLPSFCRRP